MAVGIVRDLDAYQKEYGLLPFEATQARYRKRKIVESLIRYRPGSILEIGCGLDPIFEHYPDFTHMVVVEPGDAFARKARELASTRPGITVVHGTLEDTAKALARTPYDFIILSSLLHEVANADALLRATATLCSPATIVHVNVPNAWSFHRLLAREMGLIGDLKERSEIQQQMQQSRTFDLETLSKLVADNGFDVVDHGTFFIKPFTHAQMSVLQANGLLSDRMLDGLYGLSAAFPDNGSEIYMNLRLGAK